MSNHTEYYKAVARQITPELFGYNDKTVQKTLNKYKTRGQINQLLNHIKAHMNDHHINNADPIRPLYVESTMLLMASRPCLKDLDAGLAVVIHDQNQENKAKDKQNTKQSQPFSYNVRVTFTLNHARRFLIMIVQSIAHQVLNGKDPAPLLNCLKTLIKHDIFFKWLFIITSHTNDLSKLDHLNDGYQITKLGIDMLDHLNIYSYRTPYLKLPLTYAQRDGISEKIFTSAFNATHSL